MKKAVTNFMIVLLIFSMLSGCGKKNNNEGGSVSKSENVGNSESTQVDFYKTDADMFTEQDYKTEYNESEAVTISLNDNSVAASSDSVKILDSTVTITEEGVYVISGNMSDGMLVVDTNAAAKLQLIFNGVNITNKTSAALYILEADKVFVTLAEGTENSLTNGGSFVSKDNNNIDGALFSKQDLTLNGYGKLTVTSPAGHGIVCKDDLVITGGNYVVNSAFHSLDANDSVRIAEATLSLDAGEDAIHAENADDAKLGLIYILGGNIKAEAEGDCISAGAYMQIEDGTIELLVGGGSENGTKEQSDFYGDFMGGRPGHMRYDDVQNVTADEKNETDENGTTGENVASMKGLKAATGMLISDGKIKINSADDSIHSDTSIIINGGEFDISSGDDAIHAEDTLTITSGKIDISESYEGLEALHIDVSGGDIKLVASDDGFNAAGGNDQSGTTGGRDGMYGDRPETGERPEMHGGPGGGPGGGMGHGGMSANSNGSIKISGGMLYINSSGDGMDANGSLKIAGGNITVVGPTMGDTATLDYDTSGVINGGTFIGTGAAGGMAQSFSDSEQGVVAVSVGNQAAGTEIILKDADGKEIINYAPELDFAVVILSSPDIKKGVSYTLMVGSQSGEIVAN